MSLFDTIDGCFMNFAYDWAFAKPIRKVYYNITITGLSVFVAFFIGRRRDPRVSSAQEAHLGGSFWTSSENFNINTAGFFIVGVFVRHLGGRAVDLAIRPHRGQMGCGRPAGPRGADGVGLTDLGRPGASRRRHTRRDFITEAIDGATMDELMAAVEGWPGTDRLEAWKPAAEGAKFASPVVDCEDSITQCSLVGVPYGLSGLHTMTHPLPSCGPSGTHRRRLGTDWGAARGDGARPGPRASDSDTTGAGRCHRCRCR